MKHCCIRREAQSLLYLSKNCYFDMKLLIASSTFLKKINDFITFCQLKCFPIQTTRQILTDSTRQYTTEKIPASLFFYNSVFPSFVNHSCLVNSLVKHVTAGDDVASK